MQNTPLTNEMMSNLLNPGYVQSNLEVRLIPDHLNYKGCVKRFDNLDFGLGLSIRMSDEIAITVNDSFLKAARISFDALWDKWLNADPGPVLLESMADFLGGLRVVNTDDNEYPLYICSYHNGHPGGGLIIHPQVQKMILDAFPEGFYIIFSSTQESIIVPIKYMDEALQVENLQQMLRDINSQPEIVDPSIVASQYIYSCTQLYHLERMEVAA